MSGFVPISSHFAVVSTVARWHLQSDYQSAVKSRERPTKAAINSLRYGDFAELCDLVSAISIRVLSLT
jgi:hypothetical protein